MLRLTDNLLIHDLNGETYTVRPASETDVPEVTDLIHEAFSVWLPLGLTLSPMKQSLAQTRNHLVGKGFVVSTSKGKTVGTFSLERGGLVAIDNNQLLFTEGNEVITFDRSGFPNGQIADGPLVVFKKAAVNRLLAMSGIGTQFYLLVENLAKDQGFDGIVLETIREGEWLYNWYVHLGFKAVAKHRYPGSEVDTILMIKLMGPEKK